MTGRLYADSAGRAAADAALRAAGLGAFAAYLEAKLNADESAAGLAPAASRAYAAEIDEALALVAHDLLKLLHTVPVSAGVRVIRRRIEIHGLEPFGLRRMPSRQKVRAFVRQRAAELLAGVAPVCPPSPPPWPHQQLHPAP